MNTFGRTLRLTTFGESHGEAIGGVLDGFPSGFAIDPSVIEDALERRRPGKSRLASTREEMDHVHILSGIHEGVTLGTPITFLIKNEGFRSQDYDALRNVYRPGHADYTYAMKYGVRDVRGGGRASARETAVRVAAGALAYEWLKTMGVEIFTYISSIGHLELEDTLWNRPSTPEYLDYLRSSRNHIPSCPDQALSEQMAEIIEQMREGGDSVGGVISCRVVGLPVGLGEPLYDKCSARLASAMMSINAVKGFEIGDGFRMSKCRGLEVSDEFYLRDNNIRTKANHSGGILGGITSGEDLTFRVAFKPTSSIRKAQQTVTTEAIPIQLEIQGRHDPCVALRAIPVVEAMAALTLADFYLSLLGSRASASQRNSI